MSAQRTVRPGYAVGLASMLRPLRRGLGDPTYKILGEDHWRAVRTPQGPATLRLRQRDVEVESEAWGEGDRKSTRQNSSHQVQSRMPSSA